MRLEAIRAVGTSITIALRATYENFMQPNGPSFAHTPYYIAIDGGKPVFGELVGGTSRHLVLRLERVKPGIHEIIYGVGTVSEELVWNVCVKT